MITRKIISYALIFAIGFTLVSFWSFLLVIRPPKFESGRKPADYGITSEHLSLFAEDGTELDIWFAPSDKTEAKKRALILVHGYPAEKGDMLTIASGLYPDFSLLLLDLRYFGKSKGYYTTLGIKERLDIKAAVNFLESRGYEKIGIFGFSLGGASAILTAAEDERIDAIASYASFANLKELGYETYWRLWLLKKPLVNLMMLWGRILFRESITKVSPENAAHNLSIPVFIIHSRQDEQISFQHAEKLASALSENKKAEFYFLESGFHGELPADFDKRVKEFFIKTLP